MLRRTSAGTCDVQELCPGTSATCPADGFAPATMQCRGSAGPCDVAENCSGSAAACPNDGSGPISDSSRCLSDYRGACVPPPPPDLDCDDIGRPVRIVGRDPHSLDGDGDGRACELAGVS